MSQQVIAGPNTLEDLASGLVDLSARKIFLVTGKNSFESSGTAKRLKPILAEYSVQRFHDFDPNPKIDDVHRGVRLFRHLGPDTVIAVGGGSVIDMAKVVNFWAANGIDTGGFFQGSENGSRKGCSLIAVPTTAGSGSEATIFATLYVGQTKRSVEHEGILPDIVILDPTLTKSLPPSTTASSGIDALGHAIESYWSVRSTGESKKYARDAIGLILPNLAAATNSPDPETRAALLEGAHLAGKAINISRTTAAHAVSYPLTSHFNVPHGHAVALSLSSMLGYNAGVTRENVQDPRGSEYVKETLRELWVLFGAKTAAGTMEKINDLIFEIGLETRLSRLGLKEEDVETIAAIGFDPERVKNNPRRVTEDTVKEMLLNIL